MPLSDGEEGGPGPSQQQQQSQPARHPDEELEAEQAAAEQPQQRQRHPDDDWEPDARSDSDDEGGGAGPSSAAAARLSPPPVSAAELASGELEVVSAEEDRRMIELLRQQVRVRVHVVHVFMRVKRFFAVVLWGSRGEIGASHLFVADIVCRVCRDAAGLVG